MTFTFHSFASSTLLCTSKIHSIYLDSYLETINCVSLRHFVSKFLFRFSYKVDNKFGGHIKLVSFDLSLYVARSVCVALQIAYTPVYTYIYFIFYFIHTLCFLFGEKVQQLFVSVCLFVCLFFVAHLARLQIKSCSKRNFIFSTAVELTFKLLCVSVCVCGLYLCVCDCLANDKVHSRKQWAAEREKERRQTDGTWRINKDKFHSAFAFTCGGAPTQRQLNFKFLC